MEQEDKRSQSLKQHIYRISSGEKKKKEAKENATDAQA